MTTLVNLTGDVADLIGGDFDARRTKVWIEANVDRIFDNDNDVVRLGSAAATVADDGTFTFTDLIATNSTGINPTGFQYRIVVDYARAGGDRRRVQERFGWYSLTATSDLTELAEAEEAPPTWQSSFTASMEGIRDEAEAARDQAVDISNIDTTDAAMTAVFNDEGSAFRAAQNASTAAQIESDADSPTGVITKRAKSKRLGQNVANLRRPTMAVSKMFPNVAHDHEIVWVDEVNREAFAIGQDDRLRYSTWPALPSEEAHAMNFGARISAPATGKKWASVGTFLRIRPKTGLANGAIILDERDEGQGVTTNTVLKRSTGDPASGSFLTFTTVWTAPPGVTLLGPNSLAVDEVTGYIYLVEYMPSGTVATEASIWRSTDDGATWSIWYTYPRADSGTGNVRHFHSARWDSVSERVWFTVGDFNDDAGLWRVNADGTAPEQVVTNAQLAAQTGQSAAARCVDVMFLPNHIAWPCDGSGGVNYLTVMHRDQIGSSTPQVEQIVDINSLGWWCQRASADGSAWIACGSNEVNPDQIDGGVHLYAVQELDGEVQVDEVAVVSTPVASGSISISGLGSGSGGGTAFWLRGHNYAPFPRTRYSGMQFRAELTWGAVPVIKPEASRRGYGEGVVQGVYDLAAGETKIIGHALAGVKVNRFELMDASLLVLAGTGAVKLEVYDVTAGTVLHSYTTATGSDLRHAASRVDDTAEALQAGGFNPQAGDLLHFRLVETTGTATCTASTMARWRWAFK